jgi:hypothetical protein
MGNAGARRRHRVGAQAQVFEAMSPFAPSPGGMGGGGMAGDAFTQIVLQLGPNSTEAQIADAIERLLRQKLALSRGR